MIHEELIYYLDGIECVEIPKGWKESQPERHTDGTFGTIIGAFMTQSLTFLREDATRIKAQYDLYATDASMTLLIKIKNDSYQYIDYYEGLLQFSKYLYIPDDKTVQIEIIQNDTFTKLIDRQDTTIRSDDVLTIDQDAITPPDGIDIKILKQDVTRDADFWVKPDGLEFITPYSSEIYYTVHSDTGTELDYEANIAILLPPIWYGGDAITEYNPSANFTFFRYDSVHRIIPSTDASYISDGVPFVMLDNPNGGILQVKKVVLKCLIHATCDTGYNLNTASAYANVQIRKRETTTTTSYTTVLSKTYTEALNPTECFISIVSSSYFLELDIEFTCDEYIAFLAAGATLDFFLNAYIVFPDATKATLNYDGGNIYDQVQVFITEIESTNNDSKTNYNLLTTTNDTPFLNEFTTGVSTLVTGTKKLITNNETYSRYFNVTNKSFDLTIDVEGVWTGEFDIVLDIVQFRESKEGTVEDTSVKTVTIKRQTITTTTTFPYTLAISENTDSFTLINGDYILVRFYIDLVNSSTEETSLIRMDYASTSIDLNIILQEESNPDQIIRGFTWQDMLQHVIQSITGADVDCTATSTIENDSNNNSMYNVVLFNGLQLRGWSETEQPLKINLANFFSSLRALYNIGMYWDTDHFVVDYMGNIYVKPIYDSSTGRVTNAYALGKVENLNVVVNEDILYNEVLIGNNTKSSIFDLFAQDDLTNPIECSSPINDAAKSFNAQIDGTQISGSEIEMLRKYTKEETELETQSLDATPFLLKCSSVKDGTTYVMEEEEVLEFILNKPDNATLHNLRMFPSIILDNNYSSIMGMFWKGANTLKYQSADYELETIPKLQNLETLNFYYEHQSLEVPDVTRNIFIPESIQFNLIINATIDAAIKENPHRIWEVQDKDGKYYYGYIDECGNDVYNRDNIWKLKSCNIYRTI